MLSVKINDVRKKIEVRKEVTGKIQKRFLKNILTKSAFAALLS